MANLKLKHPDSKQTITVDEEHVDRYFTQGWQDEAAKKEAEKASK